MREMPRGGVHGFGDLEAAIMDRVWGAGRPVLVREVRDRLRPERDPAYNTVLTVVENLYRKGWLARDKDGRAARYHATTSREEYTAGLMEEASPICSPILVFLSCRLAVVPVAAGG